MDSYVIGIISVFVLLVLILGANLVAHRISRRNLFTVLLEKELTERFRGYFLKRAGRRINVWALTNLRKLPIMFLQVSGSLTVSMKRDQYEMHCEADRQTRHGNCNDYFNLVATGMWLMARGTGLKSEKPKSGKDTNRGDGGKPNVVEVPTGEGKETIPVILNPRDVDA